MPRILGYTGDTREQAKLEPPEPGRNEGRATKHRPPARQRLSWRTEIRMRTPTSTRVLATGNPLPVDQSKEIDMELIDKSRQMAAAFIALADEHAAYITTSDLFTENFTNAFLYAKHMVRGGSYSSGERDIVFTQLKKLERHFV